MPFRFKKMEIPDVVLVEPIVFNDERGFFMESYKKSDFYNNNISEEFLQDNHSFSRKDVLRGMHYQLDPSAQGKLVRVVKGHIRDYAVDIRKSSKTFREWVSVDLTDENRLMLYIPPGFAHGFITLSIDAHVMYKTTAEYDGDYESGFAWNDPELNIKWPVDSPVVSERDSLLPMFKDAKIFD